MLPILLPGRYEGEGTVVQNELGSMITFKVTWVVEKPSGHRQMAKQIISMAGADEPLTNTFTFQKDGNLHVNNSALGEATGEWLSGDNYLSWELNAPPLFEGFEVIRLVGNTLVFHAEYLSSSSRNEIKGTIRQSALDEET